MKKCPKCNQSHSKNGIYCSRSCANSRIFSEKTKELKSLKNKDYYLKNPDAVKRHYDSIWTAEAREKASKKSIQNHQKRFNKALETIPWEEMNNGLRRKIVLTEQNGCCNKCKLSEWFGTKLTLELEHKDGNNQNNNRDNLEFLCPNCHSLTETWRGRNNKRKQKISDEELLKSINESKNIAQGLLKLGMAPKGRNYNRAKKLLAKNL